MKLEELIAEGLMAFVPDYIFSKGDCTKLYTRENKVYEVEKNVRTVLNNLCKYYCTDLKAARKYYGDMLSMRNLVPIPFTGDDVFVYVKVREPSCKNDSAFGFVNIRYVEKVVERNDKVFIEFINKEKIECLASIKVVERHIKNGEVIQKLYWERQNVNLQEKMLKKMLANILIME